MVLAACSVPAYPLTGEDAPIFRRGRNWGAVAGTPAFGKSMARWFLPDRREDLYFSEGWSAGQAIQTPDDLSREDPIEDDVPYAAARIGA